MILPLHSFCGSNNDGYDRCSIRAVIYTSLVFTCWNGFVNGCEAVKPVRVHAQ